MVLLRLKNNTYFRAIKKFFGAMYNGIDKDDCLGQATKISYNMLFSLIPFLIITIMILTFLGLDKNNISEILGLVTQVLPPEIHDLISGFIQRILTTPPSGLFSVSIILITWSSTTVFSEIIYGLNRIANTREFRSFWKRRLLALFLVIGVGVISGIALLFIIFGMKTIKSLGIPEIQPLGILHYRWPISLFFLFISAIILYTIAPATRPKMVHTLPGAIFFMCFVSLLTILVQRGVIKFVYRNALYGTLGSGLLLMAWFFMVSLILLVGAEINAIIERWNVSFTKIFDQGFGDNDIT